MLTVVLGVVAALLYGAADFVGGAASRSMRPVFVTALASVTGLVLLAVVSLLTAGTWSPAAVLVGALSGATGAIAIAMLYACLAIGPMSILSPVTAVVSAVVPVTWGLVAGEGLGGFGVAGLALGLGAIALVAFVPGGSQPLTPRGLALAIGSGVGIGMMLVILDHAPENAGLTPLVMHRVVGAALLGTAVLVLLLRDRRAGRVQRISRRTLGIAALAGLLDASANALILTGLRVGDLTVMSVLVALYPAGTVLLAAAVLRERITPLQWTGLALAFTAAVLLAL